MATHSSVLVWRIPGTVEPVGLPVYGVAQSRTRLKRLSSSSSSNLLYSTGNATQCSAMKNLKRVDLGFAELFYI